MFFKKVLCSFLAAGLSFMLTANGEVIRSKDDASEAGYNMFAGFNNQDDPVMGQSWRVRTPSGQVFKQNVFGLYASFGIARLRESGEKATWDVTMDDEGPGTRLMTGLGFRWTRNFNPYFGWQIINVNFHYVAVPPHDTGPVVDYQVMTGFQGNSPKFFGDMSAYGAFRFGVGLNAREESEDGRNVEFEFGVNLNPTISLGFVINNLYLGNFMLVRHESNYALSKRLYDANRNFSAIRATINLGKLQEKIITDEGWFMDFGFGVGSTRIIANLADYKTDGTAWLDVSLRRTYKFIEYVGWDIVKIKLNVNMKDIDPERMYPQIMTGVRGYSPKFKDDMRGYLAMASGVGFGLNESVGIAWEMDFGVYLNHTTSVGIGYNLQQAKNRETHTVMGNSTTIENIMRNNYWSLRLGVKF